MDDEVKRALWEVVVTRGTWAQAAKHLGTSIPYLYLVLHGKRPASAKLLKKLGLRRTVVYTPIVQIPEETKDK